MRSLSEYGSVSLSVNLTESVSIIKMNEYERKYEENEFERASPTEGTSKDLCEYERER